MPCNNPDHNHGPDEPKVSIDFKFMPEGGEEGKPPHPVEFTTGVDTGVVIKVKEQPGDLKYLNEDGQIEMEIHLSIMPVPYAAGLMDQVAQMFRALYLESLGLPIEAFTGLNITDMTDLHDAKTPDDL